jgi:pimeloyl-ACP methyl ester carboxylesterase
MPGYRDMYERAAASRTFVMYDARGTGLSDRGHKDLSLASQYADLEAIVEATGFGEFDLFASGIGSAIALMYAANHQAPVRHLVLMDPVVRGADYLAQPSIRALESYREMLDEDWQGYILTLAARLVGFEDPDAAKTLAGIFDEAGSPEMVRAYLAALPTIDVTDCLGRVRTPTLVLSFPDQAAAFPALSQEVVRRVPGARAAALPSQHRFPLTDQAWSVIETFLDEDVTPHHHGRLPESR